MLRYFPIFFKWESVRKGSLIASFWARASGAATSPSAFSSTTTEFPQSFVREESRTKLLLTFPSPGASGFLIYARRNAPPSLDRYDFVSRWTQDSCKVAPAASASTALAPGTSSSSSSSGSSSTATTTITPTPVSGGGAAATPDPAPWRVRSRAVAEEAATGVVVSEEGKGGRPGVVLLDAPSATPEPAAVTAPFNSCALEVTIPAFGMWYFGLHHAGPDRLGKSPNATALAEAYNVTASATIAASLRMCSLSCEGTCLLQAGANNGPLVRCCGAWECFVV